MKAIVIVFRTFRYRRAPEPARLGDQAVPPFWTWFIENPRGRFLGTKERRFPNRRLLPAAVQERHLMGRFGKRPSLVLFER
jgi:hypothetical protein